MKQPLFWPSAALAAVLGLLIMGALTASGETNPPVGAPVGIGTQRSYPPTAAAWATEYSRDLRQPRLRGRVGPFEVTDGTASVAYPCERGDLSWDVSDPGGSELRFTLPELGTPTGIACRGTVISWGWDAVRNQSTSGHDIAAFYYLGEPMQVVLSVPAERLHLADILGYPALLEVPLNQPSQITSFMVLLRRPIAGKPGVALAIRSRHGVEKSAALAQEVLKQLQANGVANATGTPSGTPLATIVAALPTRTPTIVRGPAPVPVAPQQKASLVTATGSFRAAPAAQSLTPGQTYSLTLYHNVTSAVVGAQAELRFDPRLVEVTSVTLAAPYAGAGLIAGRAPNLGVAAALPVANTTGLLLLAANFNPGAGQVASGDQPMVHLTLRAKGDYNGTAAVTLGDTIILMPLDTSGCTPTLTRLPVTAGTVTVTGPATPLPSAWPAAVPDTGDVIPSCE